jgi:peptidoglycan/LPS O-acetylase OafA/YrhL
MKRFTTLDMLRGVAAIGVMLYHLGDYKFPVALFPHGYLAVDFFFVLSGFVVGHAYEAKLRRGLSLAEFFIIRMIRLYPLAVLGTLAGGAIYLVEHKFFPSHSGTLLDILAALSFNIFMLPWLFVSKPPFEVFLCDPSEWSLFLEIVANLVWAVFVMRLGIRALVLFTLLSGVLLAATDVCYAANNLGWNTPTLWGGLPRVSFSFAAGLLIFRLRWCERVPAIRFGGIMLAAALLGVLAYPASLGGTQLPLWDIAAVLFMLPLLVLAGASQISEGRFAAMLGALSYPLYIVHAPIFHFVSGLHQSVLKHVSAGVLACCAVMLAAVLAFAALRWYDEPVRRRLLARAKRVPPLKHPRPKDMHGQEQQTP